MFVKALKVWWYKFTAKKGWIFFSPFKGRRQVPPSSSPRSAIPQYFKLQRTLFYTSFTCFTKMLLLYYSFTKMFWNKKCCNEILMYFLQWNEERVNLVRDSHFRCLLNIVFVAINLSRCLDVYLEEFIFYRDSLY